MLIRYATKKSSEANPDIEVGLSVLVPRVSGIEGRSTM